MCDMTHLYVWHDSFMCVTWLIDICDMTHSYVWHDSFICVTWLTHMCDMTHSYVWHVAFLCDMAYSYVWHDSFICVTWLIHMCDMKNHMHIVAQGVLCVSMCDMTYAVTNIYVWHDLCKLIERNPPPRGGFLFAIFSSSRTVCKRTPLEGFVPGSSSLCDMTCGVTNMCLCVTWLVELRISMCDKTCVSHVTHFHSQLA